jgi:hypothetical protein
MRLNIALILSITIAVGIVAFGFTFFQISSERSKLSGELDKRTTEIAERIVRIGGAFNNESSSRF